VSLTPRPAHPIAPLQVSEREMTKRARTLERTGGKLSRMMGKNDNFVLIAQKSRIRECDVKKGTGSPYSITERRVSELIPVLGSQPAGDVSHKPGGRLPLPPKLIRALLPILLLGEQRHKGCEQFA